MFRHRPFWITGLAVLAYLTCTFARRNGLAQIIPDDTLGSERSLTTPINSQSDRISGGAIRGTNLFHSFESFDITEGRRVYFANPASVTNIISRVTGNDASDIMGTLGVEGSANVFLLNPNGVVFGPNARLDVRGSFVVSTANALQFENQGFFSATEPIAPPLLTVNPSAFLFSQVAVRQTSAIATRANLSVPNGQSLLLLGSNAAHTGSNIGILMDGGVLRAPGGITELAAIAGNSTVGLTIEGREFHFNILDETPRADIILTNRAEINARAGGGGSIAVAAQNLELLRASRIRTGISTSGVASQDAGDININATGTTRLVDGSFISNSTLLGTGNTGDINITTGSLALSRNGFISSTVFSAGDAGDVTIAADNTVSVTEGSYITSNIFGRGNAGNLTIQADRISFDRVTPSQTINGAFVSVEPNAIGNGGSIHIIARSLFVTNGSQLSAYSYGRGNAGDIIINVSDRIVIAGVGGIKAFDEISGRFSDSLSGVFSNIFPLGEGTGGDIDITTSALFIRNGANITSATFGRGAAGDITIRARDIVSVSGSAQTGAGETSISGIYASVARNATGTGGDVNIATRSLSVSNRARLTVSNSGFGRAGRLTVNARSVSLNNRGIIAAEAPSTRGGDIELHISDGLRLETNSQISASTQSGRAGNLRIHAATVQLNNSSLSVQAIDRGGEAGNLTIVADQLNINNSSRATVSSLQGEAGNLTVAVPISVLNQGRLTAEAGVGSGANINLQDLDALILRNASQVSARAIASADGGNINIRAANGFVIAVPIENSDIIANAIRGRGGNINIVAQDIFGLEFRDSITTLSDINASSKFGVDGVVELNTPDVDLNRGLVSLPTEIVTPQIDQRCQAATTNSISRFVASGREGLPSGPDTTIPDRTFWEDLRVPIQSSPISVEPALESSSSAIVEAQGWIMEPNGDVALVAEAPRVTGDRPTQQSIQCSTGSLN